MEDWLPKMPPKFAPRCGGKSKSLKTKNLRAFFEVEIRKIFEVEIRDLDIKLVKAPGSRTTF